jgi:hypothetical protein
VGDPLRGDGLETGIGQDDLGIAPGRRIALHGRLDVQHQQAPQLRQPGQEALDRPLRPSSEAILPAPMLELKGEDRLLVEVRRDVVEQRPHVILHVLARQVLDAVEPRVEHRDEVLQDPHDHRPRRQPALRVQLMGRVPGSPIGRDDLLRDPPQPIRERVAFHRRPSLLPISKPVIVTFLVMSWRPGEHPRRTRTSEPGPA